MKPSNTLVAGEGARERAYLVDFGITQEVHSPERLTESGTLVGTVDYLAPERIRGETVDGRADVYSLGCVLFQCLTGEVPFPRDSDAGVIYAHLEEEPPAVSERRVGLPGALDAAVAKALAKSPDDRWQTCGELAAAAEVAIGRTATVVTRRRRARRRLRRATVALGAAAALAVAAVAAVVLLGAGIRTAAPAITAGQVIAFDAVSGRSKGRPVPAGKTPTALAVSGGKLWMVDAETRTLLRLDPKTGKLDATSIGKTPIDVSRPDRAVSGCRVASVPAPWVRPSGRSSTRWSGSTPAAQRQQASVSLPGVDQAGRSGGREPVGPVRGRAVGDHGRGRDRRGSILRPGRIDAPPKAAVRGGDRHRRRAGLGVWALAVASRVPPAGRARQGRSSGRSEIDAPDCDRRRRGRSVGDDRGAASCTGSAPRRGSIPGTIEVGRDRQRTRRDRAAACGSPTTACRHGGPGRSRRPMRVRRLVEVGGNAALVGHRRADRVAGGERHGRRGRVERRRRAAVASANCDPVLGGNGGKADLLVTSDLPLQGNFRLTAGRMADAITFVLRERRFRAGRFRLAYQSCDDALPSTGEWDEGKCVANGKAFAERPGPDRGRRVVLLRLHGG